MSYNIFVSAFKIHVENIQLSMKIQMTSFAEKKDGDQGFATTYIFYLLMTKD